FPYATSLKEYNIQNNIFMKKTIFMFLIFTSFTRLIAQVQDSVTIPINDSGLAEYSEIVLIDSASKDDLYLIALEWVNKTYKSGKNVIQSNDKDDGIIIGKAVTQTLIYNNSGIKKDGGYFSYTICIYCKDNRFKYVIDNIIYNEGDMILSPGANLSEAFPHNWTGLLGKSKQTRREWKSFQRQANTEFEIIIDSLKRQMKNSKKNSSW
ncbi:MAG: DUF4468 domain-containing protein, partial [Saprospiraceae bacterium]